MIKPIHSGLMNGTAFDLYGPADAPVVVLIHGLGLCRDMWADYISPLSAKYRVLNYDLWGHGKSAPTPQKASLRVYADQLADLMTALDIDQAVLAGFSIGGMINRRFAIDYPDHTQALIILNSPHDRGEDAQKAVETRASTVKEDGPLATLEAALTRWFTSEFRETHPDILQKIRDWREKVDPQSYAEAAWVLAAGVPELINPTPPIKAPSLVVTCEHDSGSMPDMTYAIGAEISEAKTHIISKYQHLGVLENPYQFLKLICRFLEETL